MVISEECGFPKPDPRIFQYALGRAEHDDPTSALMIGDRLDTDVEGSRRYGIPACWYNPARAPRTFGATPEFAAPS